MTTKQKPRPKINAVYRAKLNCKLGMDVLGGITTPPPGQSEVSYALYLMFRALEDIADAVDEKVTQ